MVELPSQPPQLDHNEKSCGLGPLSPYDGQQMPMKILSAAKPVTRINAPLDGPSYSKQHYGLGFSRLSSPESPQSCSGSSTASYSPPPSFKGGLDRSADRQPRGLSNYQGQNALGGAERHYYDSEKQSLSTSGFREPTSRARPAAATYDQGASTDDDSDPEDHALWILVRPSSVLLSKLSSLTYPARRSISLSFHPLSPS